MNHVSNRFLASVAGLAITALSTNAGAQTATEAGPDTLAPGGAATTDIDQQHGGIQDIVVTARKRNETLMEVPLAVSAVTAETLNQRGITNLEGVARTIPSLFLSTSAGSFQGGALGLRGISAGDNNVFGDQAVAFNIDGVQVARSTPRQLAIFDIEQVQVLKGPQALYYGKNSPAGIIVIRTADPTSSLEMGVNTQYEFVADELRGEAFISTPLNEVLGLRIAVAGGKMRGWGHNLAQEGTIYTLDHGRLPRQHDFGGRVTLKYDDGGPFEGRFKFNYGAVRSDGQYSNNQLIFCALGTPQLGGADDCKADNTAVHAGIGPQFGIEAFPFGDGSTYSKINQMLSSLELNYDLSENLSLASTSGFWQADIDVNDSVSGTDAVNATSAVAANSLIRYRNLSQELRLATDLEGPFDFMIGAHFQDRSLRYRHTVAGNALTPFQFFPPVTLRQGTTAYSFFGSVSYHPTDTVELSGGARYSKEEKAIRYFRLLPGTFAGVTHDAGYEIPASVPRREFDNVSPEATIAWRPNSRLATYISWRRGYLSGGFNGSGTVTNAALVLDNSYDDEVVQGFEGGAKGIFLNGTLRANIAAYRYNIKGLQVTSSLPGPPAVQVVTNAATARSTGFEVDFDWRTPMNGLSLRGALGYNEARYVRFTKSPCYQGQLVSQGCTSVSGAAQQDLSDQPLVRAPKLGLGLGATYEREASNGNVLTFTIDSNYTSSFYTDTLNAPTSVQDGYWLLNSSVRYEFPSGWDISLIGRNLTNTYYFQRSSQAIFTGSSSADRLSGTLADVMASISRGRELVLRLRYQL